MNERTNEWRNDGFLFTDMQIIISISYKIVTKKTFKPFVKGAVIFYGKGGDRWFLWRGGDPKIFELKGGPSQKLMAEEAFYR